MEKLEIQRYSIIDHLQFQDLITDTFNYRDNVNSYTSHGRNGQKQNSIDVSSNETKTAIQCKYKRNKLNTNKGRELIKKEIVEEVENFLYSNKFYKHFIYATTFEHDVELQNFCSEYQDKNKLPFTITYFGWNEIEKLIIKNTNIIKKYFPKLLLSDNYIEISKIDIDTENCSWVKDNELDYVFWDTPSEKSPFPILDFWLFNNSENIRLLKDIRLKIKSLYSGLSGIPTEIFTIKPYAKYEIYLDKEREFYRPNNFEPIGIPPNFPFRLQMQIFGKGKNCFYELKTRFLFYFEFHFNNKEIVQAPCLYLNTKNENEGVDIYVLT